MIRRRPIWILCCGRLLETCRASICGRSWKRRSVTTGPLDADLERISAYVGRIQRAYFLQAVVKEQLGQLEQAEEAAKKYVARAPNDLAAYKVLARVQFAKRRPTQAIETLAKVTESGKGDAETYDLIGRAYAATNQADAAIAAFQKAEALAPNDVGLQTRLASVRLGAGQVNAAIDDLEHTLELAPKLPAVSEALFFAALATGENSKAVDALAKIKAAQGDTAVTENLVGLFKLSQIDLPNARDTFSAVIRKYPNFPPAKINLARVLAMMGDRDGAEKMLTEVLASQPAIEPALGMLGSSYTQTGRQAQAVALLEAARTANPDNPRLVANLGDLYIRGGNPSKALDLVGQQKGSIADSREVLGLKAAAQLALGQKKEARDSYTQILKLDPSAIGVRRQMAALLIEAGDFETARNLVKEGIALSPRNYQLFQDLALIDLKAVGLDGALATADRLVNQDRDFTAIRGLRGDIYLAANRPDDAASAYAQALSDVPDNGIAMRLASAQLRSRKSDDAVNTLTSWIADHPDDTAVLEQLAEIQITLNHLDDAANALDRILRRKPHNAVALNNLAWVYQQKNDPRAQDLARQAYVVSPGPQTADTLGWILTTSGKPEAGAALLRQANAEAGTDPAVAISLCRRAEGYRQPG